MKCIVCGREIEQDEYSRNSEFSRLCRNPECFTRCFWKATLSDNPIIIDGVCYHIGIEPKDLRYAYDLGFGGRCFHIKMLDTGKVITTHNLKCNGEIPKEYARKDNAVFLAM